MEIDVQEIKTVIEAGGIGDLPYGRATGWTIDSRTLEPGDVFFALRGEHADGHQFVADVLQRGAAAAVVSEGASREVSQAASAAGRGAGGDAKGAVLQVANVERALQRLATWARDRWGRPIVGVTGSAGKTTTKDVIAAMLQVKLVVGKTTGNFNNHLGVPLSILRLRDAAEVGVVELGMNHAGEIRELCRIAKPTVGVVTNVGYAHIENFDSIEGIADAKRELIEALPANGTAILNADDERVAAFAAIHGGPVVTFGIEREADVRAEQVNLGIDATVFDVDGIHFRSKLPGRHGILNILAGLAAARVWGIAPADCVEAVSQLEPGRMRGVRRVWRGITVLDDCYNSNPDAVRFMIDVLKDEPAERRIAVLGEMLELGHWAEILHREVGHYVVDAGINVLVGIRGAGGFMIDAAISGGMTADAAYFFDEPEAAGAFLRNLVRAGDAILFKGSRGTHVERALAVMES